MVKRIINFLGKSLFYCLVAYLCALIMFALAPARTGRGGLETPPPIVDITVSQALELAKQNNYHVVIDPETEKCLTK